MNRNFIIDTQDTAMSHNVYNSNVARESSGEGRTRSPLDSERRGFISNKQPQKSVGRVRTYVLKVLGGKLVIESLNKQTKTG